MMDGMTRASRKPGRPATGRTPMRNIRVSDDIWLPYLDAAGAMHPEVARQLLAWYGRVPGAKLPKRPQPQPARDTSSTEEE